MRHAAIKTAHAIMTENKNPITLKKGISKNEKCNKHVLNGTPCVTILVLILAIYKFLHMNMRMECDINGITCIS